MSRPLIQKQKGFTIVELLIVIVVVAILAAISVVAFTSIQQRARRASLQSDLMGAAKKLQADRAINGAEESPSSLPAGVSPSPGNVLQLASSSDGFCINGYSGDDLVASYSLATGARDHLCDGAPIGSPVGGALPPVPRGQNLISDFSNWSLSGGVSYNPSSGELTLDRTTSGSAVSPLVRIDGASNARLTVESYATLPSPHHSPDASVYFGSEYYAADGVTRATSRAGYTSNGNAQRLSLSTWKSFTWTTATGADVQYVRFIIRNSPSNYTSDNIYRNPSISAID